MKIEEHITKKCDLINNDSLSSFMGYPAQQSHSVYPVFYEFIKNVKPKRILEIGTALGGFTRFLKICCDDLTIDTKIRSYDIYARNGYDDLIKMGIDVRIENIFNMDYTSVNTDTIKYISEEGLTIVLCDGGDKIKEFQLLSKFLKSGDIIMAHDYVDTNENFIENYDRKIWNWCEIKYNDVSESIIKNNLIQYNKEIFDKVVWLCMIKK